jgi:hypothetical protein
VLLTGGIVGGGKSDVLRVTGAHIVQYVTVNPGTFKQLTGLSTPKDHPWSSAMSECLLQRALQEGYKVVHDTQLADFSRADAVIHQTLKNKGIAYVAFTQVDPQTARARSMFREMLARDEGQPIREIPLESTAKGFNQSLPTFLQLRKKYQGNPDVRFYLTDNNIDFELPKVIIRNNQIIDPKALDEISAIDYTEIREGEKTRYVRQDAIRGQDLEAGEGAARARADRLYAYFKERTPLAARTGQAEEVLPLEGAYQLSQDIAPASAVAGIIREEGLPNLTLEQAQGAALLGKLTPPT